MKRSLIVLGVTVALAVGGTYVGAAYSTMVYLTSGGDKQVVASGGETEIQSGGTFDHQSGATLVLHGLTISSTEAGYFDGVTAGTVTASKGVVVDATKDVDALGIDNLANDDNNQILSDTLNFAAGKMTTDDSVNVGAGKLMIANAPVTSTAAELNLLDGVVIANYTMDGGDGKDTLVNANYDASTVAIFTVDDGDAAFISYTRNGLGATGEDSLFVTAYDTSGTADASVASYSAFIKE